MKNSLTEKEINDLINRAVELIEKYEIKLTELEKLQWEIFHIRNEINIIHKKLHIEEIDENTGQ